MSSFSERVGSWQTAISRTLGTDVPEISIVQQSIARDIDDEEEEDNQYVDHESQAYYSDDEHEPPFEHDPEEYPEFPTAQTSFLDSYRRPSFTVAGSRARFIPHAITSARPTGKERERLIADERSLLRDNAIIRPKHSEARLRAGSIFGIPVHEAHPPHIPSDLESLFRPESIRSHRPGYDDVPETTPLLSGKVDPSLPYGGMTDPQTIDETWTKAVAAGMITTSWQRETKVIATSAAPLIVTCLLQYSLTIVSIFSIGRLGTAELGAVSLAVMTANLTGYALYQGLATSLDTLCAQAYGSGHRKLVGLQMQRMILFLWFVTIPVGILWLVADRLLALIVPEDKIAVLAGLYLRIVLLGAPGYAAFEAGKRYVQAQGLFHLTLYVLIFVAPLNAVLNWVFVWKFEWGFVGGPIAVAMTQDMLPIGLLIAVRCSKHGMECWGGMTQKVWKNWGPMVRLSLIGALMVEAEMLAFEVLTLASGVLGTEMLAAQSIIATLSHFTFQIPFPLAVAGSTRVSNFIGAGLEDAARLSARITFIGALAIGAMNTTVLGTARYSLPYLFTADDNVAALVAKTLPVVAAFQLFDALGGACNGILRSLGRQEFGGYSQIFFYYVFAMPISFGTAFGLNAGLTGLWAGPALSLCLNCIVEFTYINRIDWNKSIEEAKARNEEGHGA